MPPAPDNRRLRGPHGSSHRLRAAGRRHRPSDRLRGATVPRRDEPPGACDGQQQPIGPSRGCAVLYWALRHPDPEGYQTSIRGTFGPWYAYPPIDLVVRTSPAESRISVSPTRCSRLWCRTRAVKGRRHHRQRAADLPRHGIGAAETEEGRPATSSHATTAAETMPPNLSAVPRLIDMAVRIA